MSRLDGRVFLVIFGLVLFWSAKKALKVPFINNTIRNLEPPKFNDLSLPNRWYYVRTSQHEVWVKKLKKKFGQKNTIFYLSKMPKSPNTAFLHDLTFLTTGW